MTPYRLVKLPTLRGACSLYFHGPRTAPSNSVTEWVILTKVKIVLLTSRSSVIIYILLWGSRNVSIRVFVLCSGYLSLFLSVLLGERKLNRSCHHHHHHHHHHDISHHRPFLLGDFSVEPTVIPTAQASSFILQYFPYYV